MSDIREALVAHLERSGIGYGLHDGLKRDVLGAWADAILAEFDVTERGVHNHDIDPACPETRLPDGSPRGECTTNASPPTVKPTLEQVVDVLAAQPPGRGEWTSSRIMQTARAVLALFPGRTEAEVKAEALREAAPGCNCEDDYAWLNDRAARIEKGEGRG